MRECEAHPLAELRKCQLLFSQLMLLQWNSVAGVEMAAENLSPGGDDEQYERARGSAVNTQDCAF